MKDHKVSLIAGGAGLKITFKPVREKSQAQNGVTFVNFP